MKRTKKGFVSTLVGISISFVNAIIQFLLIYWVLRTYGTEFNGFIRLTSAFSIIGGTTEGALGISTVILLIKPLANRDFITANEIFSTARSRYRKGIITNSILMLLIAIGYPLVIMIGPSLLSGDGKIVLEMKLIFDGQSFMNIHFYQLVIIILFFGVKNIVTAGFFGVYENIIQADQQNGVRRLIILFTDVLIYGIIFGLLNVRINGYPLNPIFCFMILILYGPIRGALIRLYVKRNYSWIKFYPEFNNFQLRQNSSKMFLSSIGQGILFNADIVIVVVTLGAYGLRTSSMLSLYLIVGLNTRLIMTNFITSFREYFVSVLVKEGRLEWKDYSYYELYLYVVSAFTFIIMALLSPYLVNALYGDLVQADLNKLADPNSPLNGLNVAALQNAKEFMFQKPMFSILYASTTAFILLIQGEYTLIQAKGRVEQVSRWIDIFAIIFIVIAASMIFIFSIPQRNDNFIVDSLTVYYSVKVIFMFITFAFLWVFNWSKGTYNSNTHYILLNLAAFAIPVILSIMVSLFILAPLIPVTYQVTDNLGNIITKSSFEKWTSLLLYIVIIISSALLIVSITALSLRPKVAFSLILMLPVVKQIISKSKNKSRIKRLQAANIDVKYFDNDQEIYSLVSFYNNSDVEFSINTVPNLDDIFKPKIYKLKDKKEDENKEKK